MEAKYFHSYSKLQTQICFTIAIEVHKLEHKSPNRHEQKLQLRYEALRKTGGSSNGQVSKKWSWVWTPMIQIDDQVMF